MNIIKDMIQTKYFKKYFLLTLLFTFSIKAFSQEDGAKIFKQNCTACHVLGETKLIGPGLKGITEKRDKEWLKKWINNSSELIASGDADAIAIFEEYNKVAMTNFYFSDEEFEALFAYLDAPPVEEAVVATQATVVAEEKISTSTQLMIVALILLIFIPQTGARDYGVLAWNLIIGSPVPGFPSYAPKIPHAIFVIGPC